MSGWRRWAAGCALAASVLIAVLAAAALAGWWFVDLIGVMELPLFPFGPRWTVARDLAKANANAYAIPADGALSEERVLAFLRVRAAMHAAYEDGRRRNGLEANLSPWRVTQARARHLAAERMSEAEYAFIGSALLDLCPVQDEDEARRGKELFLSGLRVTGLPSPSPLPPIPPRSAWPESVEAANLALATTHRAEMAKFDEMELKGAMPRPDRPDAPCWARAAGN